MDNKKPDLMSIIFLELAAGIGTIAALISHDIVWAVVAVAYMIGGAAYRIEHALKKGG